MLRIGDDATVGTLHVAELDALACKAESISLGEEDLQTTLNTLSTQASNASQQADWNNITSKPSDNSFLDWTVDQVDTNIDANNYINTTYTLASNGSAGLSQYNFTLARALRFREMWHERMCEVKSLLGVLTGIMGRVAALRKKWGFGLSNSQPCAGPT